MLPQEAREWDIQLWGNEQPEAIYLHRLAIDRSVAGKNLGKEILNWVTEGIVFEGKNVIRLDCIATNESLNTFYREAGFTYRGTSDTGFNIYDKPKNKKKQPSGTPLVAFFWLFPGVNNLEDLFRLVCVVD